MLKTLIKLSAVQNSALSNYLFPAHEKKSTSHFLTGLPSKGEKRVSVNKAGNKFLEEKNYIYSHNPLVSFPPLLKCFFLIRESK